MGKNNTTSIYEGELRARAPKAHCRAIERIAKQRRVKTSQILREAVQEYIDSRKSTTALAA